MCGIRKAYSLCLSLYSSVAAAVVPVDASPALRVFVAPVSSSVPALAAALLPTVPVVAYTHMKMKNKVMTNSKWLTITAKSQVVVRLERKMVVLLPSGAPAAGLHVVS